MIAKINIIGIIFVIIIVTIMIFIWRYNNPYFFKPRVNNFKYQLIKGKLKNAYIECGSNRWGMNKNCMTVVLVFNGDFYNKELMTHPNSNFDPANNTNDFEVFKYYYKIIIELFRIEMLQKKTAERYINKSESSSDGGKTWKKINYIKIDMKKFKTNIKKWIGKKIFYYKFELNNYAKDEKGLFDGKRIFYFEILRDYNTDEIFATNIIVNVK